jgi:hypothetical protein
MKITAIVEALVQSGATPEMILAAVRVAEAQEVSALEASREKTRQRVARWREAHPGNVTERYVTSRNGSREGVTRVEGLTSNSEIEPQEENKKRATSALSAEFDTTFWPAFPNKTGKPKALSAFLAARRKAELTAIMAGLRRYVASKPPDRPWLNPATFLNQERWDDQPAFTARAGPAPRSNPLADAFGSMRPPDERHPPPTDDTVLYLPAAAR